MSAQVLALREILERRFPDAVPVGYRTAGAVGTGVAELDRVLPAGGLPRGRLSVWVGRGATAVLRAACQAALARGERAAWVDVGGVISGGHWGPGPLLVRPAGEVEGLECAEALLRSGGFGLVVLAASPSSFPVIPGVAAPFGGVDPEPFDPAQGRLRRGAQDRLCAVESRDLSRVNHELGLELMDRDTKSLDLRSRPGGRSRESPCHPERAPRLRSGQAPRVPGAAIPDSERVRLSRAVRQGGSALVVLGPALAPTSLRLASRILPDSYHWRPGPFGEPAVVEAVTVQVRVSAMGWSAHTEFVLPVVQHDLRMSLEPELVDRRGAGA